MEGLFVYLIFLVVGLLIRAAKKNTPAKQNGAAQTARNPQKPAQQPVKKPVQKPSAATRQLTQDDIRKVAQSLLKNQAAPSVSPAQPKVTLQTDEAFYEGTSFGDEGVDPCHDDMFGERPAVQNIHDRPAPVPALSLQFTADSVLNGIIMSEVLKRRTD